MKGRKSTPPPPAAAPAAQPPVAVATAQGPTPESLAAAASADAERAAAAEQRFKSLKGKYDQEVGNVKDINRQQAELITQLLKERAAPAAAAAPAPAPAANATPEDILKSLGATDKDIEDYGELLPIVAKLAQNMFRPSLKKLEDELANLKAASGTVSSELVKSKQKAVWDALDHAVPNWRVINADDQFLDWLSIVDIFSGVTRRVALTSAFTALDADRVAGIFKAYVQEDPSRAATAGSSQVDPATLLAPGSPRAGSEGAPEGAGGKKLWSEDEIKHFHYRVRKKQVSPEEYERTSHEIAVAVSEGRVRPSSNNRHINDQ
jgi:hypothetical protein